MLNGVSQFSFVASSIIDDLQIEVIDQRDLSVTDFESHPTVPSWRNLFALPREGPGPESQLR